MRVIAPGEIRPKLAGNWLIKGLVPKVGLGAIYGPSGHGKTFFALDLAMAIARGVPWRGRKTERAAVLYLSPDGGEMVQNRIVAYCQRHNIELGDHSLYLAPFPIDLLNRDRDGTRNVVRTVERIETANGVKVGLVMVDTVSRAMPGGDENGAKDVTRFIDNLSAIASGERAVIGIHHTPKSNATVLRGHSALHGACDFELNVVAGGDPGSRIGTMTSKKQRDGEDGQRLGFGLDVVEIGRDEDGEAVTSCVVIDTDAERHVGKCRKMSTADHIAMRTISNLIAEHGEPLPQGAEFPTGGRHVGVSVRMVSQALRGSLFSGRTPEAAQKSWERLRNKLHTAGMIGVNGGMVWIPDAADKPTDTDISPTVSEVSAGILERQKPTDSDTPQ
jgi:hypothetical protein